MHTKAMKFLVMAIMLSILKFIFQMMFYFTFKFKVMMLETRPVDLL
jgi:hypothetical protein